MKASGEKYGLKTLTEVMDSAHCEMVHSYVDGLQIGARNMQNFSLLKNVGAVTAVSYTHLLTIEDCMRACGQITSARPRGELRVKKRR